jgi:hypothetical protein
VPGVRAVMVRGHGGQPISWVSLACDLQRDWARQKTIPAIVEMVISDRPLNE